MKQHNTNATCLEKTALAQKIKLMQQYDLGASITISITTTYRNT